MDDASNARQLISGPITDAGQLLLALVINELAGPDGWAVVTGTKLYSLARIGERTGRKKLNELVEMGVIEWQKKPPQALRLTVIHRHQMPVHRQEMPLHRQEMPVGDEQDHRHQMPLDRHEMPVHRQEMPVDNASAYLPKRYKDKEKEVKEKNPPPPPPPPPAPPGELVLVATNPAPESPRLDQPAAQPPAVVEQAEGRPDELLPVPAKRKAAPPKRKTPRKKPRVRITEDWQPEERTLAGLEARQGIPLAFSEACVWEFITHWMGDGEARSGWDSTFVNSVKYSWDKEQKRAKTQRYTDASGRPISEAQYVARQNTKRVIADIESGVLDGVPLDQLKF